VHPGASLRSVLSEAMLTSRMDVLIYIRRFTHVSGWLVENIVYFHLPRVCDAASVSV